MPNIPMRMCPTRTTPGRSREQAPIRLTKSRITPALGRNIGPLRSKLAQVKSAWTSYRCTRDRGAVFSYLQAVFDLVTMWRGREDPAIAFQRALEIATGKSQIPAEPFAAVIVCTSDVAKVDGRTLSKWSRALQYVASCKKEADSLKAFMTQTGGVNACASRLDRRPKGSGALAMNATARRRSGRSRR